MWRPTWYSRLMPLAPSMSRQVRAISSGLHLEAEVAPNAVQAGEPFTLTVRVTNDAGSVIQEINSTVSVAVRNASSGEPGRGTLLNGSFQLLQGELAIGNAVRRAGEILLDAGLAAIDGHRRELVDKDLEHFVQHCRSEPCFELDQRIAEERWFDRVAISGHDGVHHLVDEPHGVDLARLDRLLGVFLEVGVGEDAFGNVAAGSGDRDGNRVGPTHWRK